MSRIVYVIKLGLQWKDAPSAHPNKTLYNCFIRWK
ncbi:transposase [Bartonella sp. P0282]